VKSKGAPWATFLEAPGADLTGSWYRAACTEWRRGTGPRHSLGDVVRCVAWRYAHGRPAACVTAASCGPLGRNNLPQEPLQRDVLAAARVHTHTRGGEYGRTLNCWLRGAILHRTLTGSGVLPPIPAPRGAIWALLRPGGGSALTGATRKLVYVQRLHAPQAAGPDTLLTRHGRHRTTC